MAQSTRPASANGSARQDTRAAGRPARSSADGAVRSLPEPRPRAQAMALPGRSRRQPCTRGWKPSPPPGSAKSGAARIGWARAGPPWRTPARISSMICGSTCAGCARCPTCCHGRQARAHASRAAQGSGLGHALSRARDWDVFTMEVLPQLCDADPDIDPQASAARARARSEIAHDEMYANLQTERFQAMLRLLRERSAGSPPPWPSARPGRCIARSAAASRVGTRRCARAWITPPTRGRGASMRRGSASNACAMPARRCCCSVHPASSSATSRPWPTCKARWAARRTSAAAALGRDVCQPVDRQAGGSTRRQSGPAIAAQGRRWPALSQPAPAAAAVFLGAGQPRTVARRLGPAGAEAPRATA